MAIELAHKRLEVGGTWTAPPWERTAINTEARLLMLRHVFETLSCFRVELKTDALNAQSRHAILRLGARQEGIFRSHVITANGRRRDSVYFSILDSEWPDVKAKLEARLLR
jgi:RimJ/RimL family protein N-acetyltransferase